MRLKRATSMKKYRRRRQRRPEQLGDELGARPRRRRRGGKRRSQRFVRPTGRKPGIRRPAPEPEPWSEAVPLGEHIRIQAEQGYRGAFLELRPGLYLVAELSTTGLEGEFGRKVKTQDVTNEIVRVTDKALDAIFPKRRAQKRQQADEVRRRQALARREAEAERQRQRAAQAQAQQQRALPAPQESSLPRGAARWLDEDEEPELAGCAHCGGHR
jgi:hypothetical protein